MENESNDHSKYILIFIKHNLLKTAMIVPQMTDKNFNFDLLE